MKYTYLGSPDFTWQLYFTHVFILGILSKGS